MFYFLAFYFCFYCFSSKFSSRLTEVAMRSVESCICLYNPHAPPLTQVSARARVSPRLPPRARLMLTTYSGPGAHLHPGRCVPLFSCFPSWALAVLDVFGTARDARGRRTQRKARGERDDERMTVRGRQSQRKARGEDDERWRFRLGFLRLRFGRRPNTPTRKTSHEVSDDSCHLTTFEVSTLGWPQGLDY